MPTRPPKPEPLTLVLLSGGLDSAVLLAHEARKSQVLPVYVASGLAWEARELAIVERLIAHPSIAPIAASVVRADVTLRDIYPPTHWAIQGTPPAYDTSDSEVYLPGRNLVLLTKAGIVAATHGAHRIALAPLSGNPFPDARPEFFEAMQLALGLGLDHRIEVITPFLSWTKPDVIRRGVELGVPLHLTLSCMNPVEGERPGDAPPLHCGRCSKCRERLDAFASLAMDDPASYAAKSPR